MCVKTHKIFYSLKFFFAFDVIKKRASNKIVHQHLVKFLFRSSCSIYQRITRRTFCFMVILNFSTSLNISLRFSLDKLFITWSKNYFFLAHLILTTENANLHFKFFFLLFFFCFKIIILCTSSVLNLIMCKMAWNPFDNSFTVEYATCVPYVCVCEWMNGWCPTFYHFIMQIHNKSHMSTYIHTRKNNFFLSFSHELSKP